MAQHSNVGRSFKDYQVEELVEAQAYLVAESIKAPCRVRELTTKKLATFYGLTHNIVAVCAVIRFDDESWLRLVHYSQLTLETGA